MKRSEIKVWNLIPGRSDLVYVKSDADRYIDKLESAFLKLVHDEFGRDENDDSEEGIERLVEWALRR